MARMKMLSLLAISVVMCILTAASVAPAVAQDSSYMSGDRSAYNDKSGKGGYDGCRCGCDGDRGMCRDGMGYGGMHKGPKDIYMAVSGGSMSENTASFSIDSIGMTGMKELAVEAMPGSPLTGTYNVTSDMGYISTSNILPLTMVIDKAGSVAIPTGNASAIIGLHGVKTLMKEKGYKVSEFRSVSVFLPDGTVKFFKLEEPVRITYAKDRKMIVIDAYPTFTQRMGSVFSGAGGQSYSAMGMSSMSMADLQSMESKAQAETIEYKMPAYVEPPK
jgi:hypothetical protein